MNHPRRDFLIGASALIGSGLVVPLSSSSLAAQKAGTGKKEEKKGEAEEQVSTNEDLMREHGVLNRILLIYDEANRRIQSREKFDTSILSKSATLIKTFIEDYHEKLEENHLFPRFEQAGKLVELVENLRAQHAMGRRVTDKILATSKSNDMDGLGMSLTAFVRMYRPHEAREDTVLFPALHDLVSKHEYDAMGEQFEKIERQTFGGDGFDMAVDKVTELEKQFGIYDISNFTPDAAKFPVK